MAHFTSSRPNSNPQPAPIHLNSTSPFPCGRILSTSGRWDLSNLRRWGQRSAAGSGGQKHFILKKCWIPKPQILGPPLDGETTDQPIRWNNWNQSSLENGQQNSRCSIVSGACDQRAHESSSCSPCFFRLAAVQHLSCSTNQMKNLHLGGARAFRSNVTPSTGCCPIKNDL